MILRAMTVIHAPAFGPNSISSHRHPWHHLIYAADGAISVETSKGSWVVPPQRAVWVDAEEPHAIAMHGTVTLCTLYFPLETEGLPLGGCRVVEMTPLLREAALRASQLAPLLSNDPAQVRLAGIILDEHRDLPIEPLSLPMPSTAQARAVADHIRAEPGDDSPPAVLARDAGASLRTIERQFRGETGLSLGRWRQQARLLHALPMLAAGRSVTETALEVGYGTPSAFIAAFRSALGVSPGRYYGVSGRDRR